MRRTASADDSESLGMAEPAPPSHPLTTSATLVSCSRRILHGRGRFLACGGRQDTRAVTCDTAIMLRRSTEAQQIPARTQKSKLSKTQETGMGSAYVTAGSCQLF